MRRYGDFAITILPDQGPSAPQSHTQLHQFTRWIQAQAELVTFYPNRGAVPRELWLALVDQATTSIDALMFAGLFLTDRRLGFESLQAHSSTSGRLCS